jgi:hypothetical protein
LKVEAPLLTAHPQAATQQLAEPDSPMPPTLCYDSEIAFVVSVLQSMGSQVSSKGFHRKMRNGYEEIDSSYVSGFDDTYANQTMFIHLASYKLSMLMRATNRARSTD